MIFPPCVTLGTILGRMPRWYDDHVMVAIKSAYVYGYANPLWSRSEAVRVAVAANLALNESRGHGNAADRRARHLSQL